MWFNFTRDPTSLNLFMLGTDFPVLHEASEIIHSPTISEGSGVGEVFMGSV